MLHCRYESPFGTLTLTECDGNITHLLFSGTAPAASTAASAETGHSAVFREAMRQLDAYFLGTLREFTLPLAPGGTAFQSAVWQALTRIPYGKTASYGEIAAAVGSPKAARAVGMANNKNPIAIIIPCHRVIGGNGSLTGYAGGLNMKRRLLELEAGLLPLPLQNL